MKSVVKKCYDYFKVVNVQWSLSGLDYSKSMYHDHFKVDGEQFFNFLNLNFVFEY